MSWPPDIAVLSRRRRREGAKAGARPLVSDSFNRANGAIGVADTGQTWIDEGEGWQVLSNTARATGSPGALGAQACVLNAGVSDCTITVTFSTYSSAQFIAFRLSDVNNLLAFYLSGTNTARILKLAAGTQTTAYTTTTNTNIASGDIYSVTLSGSSITLKQNGVQIGTTQTNSFNQTATNHGIGTNTTASRFDTFSVTVP